MRAATILVDKRGEADESIRSVSNRRKTIEKCLFYVYLTSR
jgi:hypothetical protein